MKIVIELTNESGRTVAYAKGEGDSEELRALLRGFERYMAEHALSSMEPLMLPMPTDSEGAV